MIPRPREASQLHTRLLKCALEVEDSRAYWTHTDGTTPTTPQRAFDEYWFGAKSLARIKVLFTNMRARYDAFPAALATLHRWPDMAPDTRRLICHWHLQLADPLYRAFTGDYLVARRARARAELTRDLVTQWVGQQGPHRWTMATRIQFASKLLSAAFSTGLVTTNRDPRPLTTPRVPDEALTYLLYLLRGVELDGTMLENPYLASVGLDGGVLEDRLRALPDVGFRRQRDLVDLQWPFPDLASWTDAHLAPPRRAAAGAR